MNIETIMYRKILYMTILKMLHVGGVFSMGVMNAKKQYLHNLILKYLKMSEADYYLMKETDRVDMFLDLIKDTEVQKKFWLDAFGNIKDANMMLLLYFDGIVAKFRPKLVFDVWDCLENPWELIDEVLNYIEVTCEKYHMDRKFVNEYVNCWNFVLGLEEGTGTIIYSTNNLHIIFYRLFMDEVSDLAYEVCVINNTPYELRIFDKLCFEGDEYYNKYNKEFIIKPKSKKECYISSYWQKEGGEIHESLNFADSINKTNIDNYYFCFDSTFEMWNVNEYCEQYLDILHSKFILDDKKISGISIIEDKTENKYCIGVIKDSNIALPDYFYVIVSQDKLVFQIESMGYASGEPRIISFVENDEPVRGIEGVFYDSFYIERPYSGGNVKYNVLIEACGGVEDEVFIELDIENSEVSKFLVNGNEVKYYNTSDSIENEDVCGGVDYSVECNEDASITNNLISLRSDDVDFDNSAEGIYTQSANLDHDDRAIIEMWMCKGFVLSEDSHKGYYRRKEYYNSDLNFNHDISIDSFELVQEAKAINEKRLKEMGLNEREVGIIIRDWLKKYLK